MAAEHRYTSSLFIQKGALAQFQSGISASNLNVNGNVFASAYFKLDGTEVTGGGGLSAAKFLQENLMVYHNQVILFLKIIFSVLTVLIKKLLI